VPGWGYTDADPNCYSNSDTDCYSNSYANGDTNSYARAQSHAQAAADAAPKTVAVISLILQGKLPASPADGLGSGIKGNQSEAGLIRKQP
jgi:hypothetical protein